MPFLDWEDFESCVVDMQEEGYDKESAEAICGSLEEESDNYGEESAESLKEQILSSASGLIDDLYLELVSAVETPAQPSDWVLMKSDKKSFDWKTSSDIVFSDLSKEEDKRIAYAPAMVPDITDKQGDVIPAHVIEDAAHKYLTKEGGIDADHDLIEGKGEVVESWVLKEDREFLMPDGEEKKYPKGTWMLGVKFNSETWDRIKQGELSGFSIYGDSRKLQLSKSSEKNIKEKNNIDIDNNKDIMVDNMEVEEFEEVMDEFKESLDVSESLNELKESIEDLKSEMDSKEEVEDVETEEEDETEEVQEDEKQDIENLTDAIDWIDENAPDEVADMIVDAVRGEEEEAQDEDEDEDEDDEEKEAKSKADFTPLDSDEDVQEVKSRSFKERAEKVEKDLNSNVGD